MSWNVFLHGNTLTGVDKEIGLLKTLSQRIGMIKQISKFMSQSQLKTICSGMFTSKLLYCLPLFSNVWGVSNLDDTDRRFTSMTKEDMRKLQVLQNKVLRIKTKNIDLNTPTTDLLASAGDLSVQQLGALHTLLYIFKIVRSGEPMYLAEKPSLGKQFRVESSHLGRSILSRFTEISHYPGQDFYTGGRSFGINSLQY